MADPVFAPGDRVATNALYAKRFPRDKTQTGGTIIAAFRGYRDRFRVLWDGRKTEDDIHASFLKREGPDG